MPCTIFDGELEGQGRIGVTLRSFPSLGLALARQLQWNLHWTL